MARRKITYEQAANELRQAYDEGYASGLAGRPDIDGFPKFSEWGCQLEGQRVNGCRDGYAEFTRRVCAVKCSELPPPSPPPKVTFDPGYLYGGRAAR